MLSLLANAGADPIQWAELGLTPGIDLGFFTLRWYSLAYLAGILLFAGTHGLQWHRRDAAQNTRKQTA